MWVCGFHTATHVATLTERASNSELPKPTKYHHFSAMAAVPTPAVNHQSNESEKVGARVVLALAGAKLLLHLLSSGRFGIFRDEMYVIACARHLDWGYVDHPPGGILIGWIAYHIFGHWLPGLRLLPTLAGAGLVIFTAKVVREMGGRSVAQVLAALAVCVVPIYQLFDSWLTMNAFEPLIWLGCFYCVLRAVNTGSGRTWLGFGVLAGIGFETKYSVLFLVAGVLIGLLLTPQRRFLADGRLWIGLLVCAAIALPNFLWQLHHGFPFVEMRQNLATGHRDVVRGPGAFLLDQMMIMGPLTAPLWIGGTVWLLVGRERARYGAFGWAFLFVLGSFIALKGKNYYVTPCYPVVFAAGAVAFEAVTGARNRQWLRVAYPASMAVTGLALLPIAVPILAPDSYIRYVKWIHVTPSASENQNNGPLPQYFADEFGWADMVREVARVYQALPLADRNQAVIFSNGWGEAAAIDFFGPTYGLPRAICPHDSYWLWGPGDCNGKVVIVLRTDGRGDRKAFATVEKAGSVSNPYSRRDEWFDIYVCRGLKFNLREAWPGLKRFN